MNAVLIPFPLARRRYLTKQANVTADLRFVATRRFIDQQVRTAGNSLRRLGIAEAVIEREQRELEAALKAELDRIEGAAAETMAPRA
jgi:hypothetical protein